jgi:hypothetical protein
MICREEWSLGIDGKLSDQCVSYLMEDKRRCGQIVPQIQFNSIGKVFYSEVAMKGAICCLFFIPAR